MLDLSTKYLFFSECSLFHFISHSAAGSPLSDFCQWSVKTKMRGRSRKLTVSDVGK